MIGARIRNRMMCEDVYAGVASRVREPIRAFEIPCSYSDIEYRDRSLSRIRPRLQGGRLFHFEATPVTCSKSQPRQSPELNRHSAPSAMPTKISATGPRKDSRNQRTTKRGGADLRTVSDALMVTPEEHPRHCQQSVPAQTVSCRHLIETTARPLAPHPRRLTRHLGSSTFA